MGPAKCLGIIVFTMDIPFQTNRTNSAQNTLYFSAWGNDPNAISRLTTGGQTGDSCEMMVGLDIILFCNKKGEHIKQ